MNEGLSCVNAALSSAQIQLACANKACEQLEKRVVCLEHELTTTQQAFAELQRKVEVMSGERERDAQQVDQIVGDSAVSGSVRRARDPEGESFPPAKRRRTIIKRTRSEEGLVTSSNFLSGRLAGCSLFRCDHERQDREPVDLLMGFPPDSHEDVLSALAFFIGNVKDIRII